MEDILADYSDKFNSKRLEQLRSERIEKLQRPCWSKLLAAFEELPKERLELSCSNGVLRVGSSSDLSSTQHESLKTCLEELIPWRKGPFDICGQYIDAEWRSDLKWERLRKVWGSFEGKRVLDIGCGNGYYMFRALEHSPRFVLGIDPSEKFYFVFQLLQRFVQSKKLQFELLGVEELGVFQGLFDVVLCMGISYHQRDPIGMLRLIKSSLAPGGELVFEGFYVEGDEPTAFFPPGRYAKARNVFFIPTLSCLEAWLSRSGFEGVEILSLSVTTSEEQRKTKFAPFESLSDFLDPEDPEKTIEGYPRPRRFVLRAQAKQ